MEMTVCSTPRCVEPPEHLEFNISNYPVDDLGTIPNLKKIENIADPESQA
jgi:hypothetical protein